MARAITGALIFCLINAANLATAMAWHKDAPPRWVTNDRKDIVVLRSGEGQQQRAVSIQLHTPGANKYDGGMSMGLFAMGIDFRPDLKSASKQSFANTVAVDGRNPFDVPAKTTLRVNGKWLHAMVVSSPEMIKGRQFERSAILVDIDANDFYVVDIFRVVGGKEHVKFINSSIAVAVNGLNPVPVDHNFGNAAGNCKIDTAPRIAWNADWKAQGNSDVHLRYTDLTTQAAGGTYEMRNSEQNKIFSQIFIKRTSTDGNELSSAFAGVFEPYLKTSRIKKISRISIEPECGGDYPDSCIAVEVEFTDGKKDIIVSMDYDTPLAIWPVPAKYLFYMQPYWFLRGDAQLCHIRRDAKGNVEKIAFANGRSCEVDEIQINLAQKQELFEKEF